MVKQSGVARPGRMGGSCFYTLNNILHHLTLYTRKDLPNVFD